MLFKTNIKDIPYKKKVAIIGTGFVGSTTAYAIMMKELAREIVLVDINRKASQGEILDIAHGIPSMGSGSIYAGDYSDCKDSDLIIITAGRNRREGETRLELAEGNLSIVKSVLENLAPHYTKGIILLITNPVDIITQKAIEWTGLPEGRVFGTGCLLDSSRFVRAIADHLSVNTELVHGMIVGEHGESQLPVWSMVTVSGIQIDEYCKIKGIPFTLEDKQKIADTVRTMGADIIKTKGKTHFGIATCVASLADAIINGRTTISTVSTILKGEYGVNGIATSLPCIVSNNGVEKRLTETFSDEEVKLFKDSAEKLEKVVNQFKDI